MIVTSRRGLLGVAAAIGVAAVPSIAAAAETPVLTAFIGYLGAKARLYAYVGPDDDARDRLCAQLKPWRTRVGILPAHDAQDVAIKAWLALDYFDDDKNESGMGYHAALARIFPRIAAMTASVPA